MSELQRNLLIGLTIAAAVALGAYLFIWKGSFGLENNNTATTSVNGVTGTGSFTVEAVEIKPPSINRPLTITADLPNDAKEILKKLVAQQKEILAKEPTRVDVWLQYGINLKIAGDYQGAIEAWEYVANAAPDPLRATAYGNLGTLYMYSLKEYVKAEPNYLHAIALSPNVIEYYRALFYLYRDIFKDKAKAQAIVEQGLKSNPNNPDLLGLKKQP